MVDIKLKRLTISDIEQVRTWRNSPEVASYMYDESYITEDQQIKWFEKINNLESCIFWIIEYNGKNLGLACITGIDRILNSCYWAFYLGDSTVRGQGIGAKIEYNLLQYVFNEIKINKLRCEVLVTNDKVIKMHEKFGFRREAYYREHCIKKNKKLDAVGLALLSSEWLIMEDSYKNKIYGKQDN